MKWAILLSVCFQGVFGFCADESTQSEPKQKPMLPQETKTSESLEEEELIGFEDEYEDDDNNFEIIE